LFLHGSNGTLVTSTTSVTGTAVDLQSGTPKRGLVANWRFKTLAGTIPTMDCMIQASTDNTTFVNLSVPQRGQIAAAGSRNATFMCDSPFRYVRSVVTAGGTPTACTFDCVLGIQQP
jgi:hypothetical protein